jgi:bisphosphoglycerate-dependent phosphoglycerate mutase
MVPALTLCALIKDPSSLVHSQQALLPKTESLKTTEARFLVEWEDNIKGDIKSGKKVLVRY